MIRVRDRRGGEAAYEVLAARILDQHYKTGERIEIGALVRELRVGPGEVRLALDRLTAQGLVSASAHRYVVASVPDERWFDDLHEFRVVLETWAVREVALHRPHGPLARMKATIAFMERDHALTFDEYRDSHEADKVFHTALIEGAGNWSAVQAYGNLDAHLHYARLYCRSPRPSSLALAEHQAIFDAIERGDAAAAAAAMRVHLENSRNRLRGVACAARNSAQDLEMPGSGIRSLFLGEAFAAALGIAVESEPLRRPGAIEPPPLEAKDSVKDSDHRRRRS